jgi:hypothetical protein
MKDVLFVLVGVAVFVSLLFGFLVFSMRWAHARVRFEKIKRELKQQGRYEEWANTNRALLVSKAIVTTGVWSGLPGFLLFDWFGYRQISTTFLGVFIICLAGLAPINWILYNKIVQDLK